LRRRHSAQHSEQRHERESLPRHQRHHRAWDLAVGKIEERTDEKVMETVIANGTSKNGTNTPKKGDSIFSIIRLWVVGIQFQ